MKLLIGSVILAASTTLSWAQGATQPAPPQPAKVMAEVTATFPKSAIKNSPFSADEVNESVQTLADGNRIVRNSTGKFYRNGDGRVRREMSGGVGGMMGSLYSTGEGISILNPSIGQRYTLDTELKTATVFEMGQGQRVSIAGTKIVIGDEKTKALKLNASPKDGVKPDSPAIAIAPPPPPGFATTIMPGQGGLFTYPPSVANKYETKTEDLGTRDFEGISAEGSRKTTTIPTGAIGNERPIEIIYERWFSNDLGVVVYSKNNDPRFGEQTYKLKNLVRAEPDPSLFSLPTGYKVISTKPLPSIRALTKMAPVQRPAVELSPLKATPVIYKVKTAEKVTVLEKVKP